MSDATTERVTSPSRRPHGAGTGTGAPVAPPEDPITSSPQARKPVVRPGDRIFSGLATGSGAFITLLIVAIAAFLVLRAVPALQRDQVNFLTSREFDTSTLDALRFGVLDLFGVTVLVSLFALVLAMPVALGIAIFLTSYAPRAVAKPLAYVIDLLAAVPSIVYGLWGLLVVAEYLDPVGTWISSHLGFIPIFSRESGSGVGGTIFLGGIVLAVMILPIITAVTREVFVQTPTAQVEAALALGATRWEVVRTCVLPFGKSGFVSGTMLGLGRALGETIALYIILRTTTNAFGWSLFEGGATFASKIALGSGEFNNNIVAGAYIAAGLVLFILTFAINSLARAAVAGKKER
ncbi:phosphate ABC transporter permease subunit PstC [Rhodococcus aerolatus]